MSGVSAATSSDSGQGSAPLSDPFVATTVVGDSRIDSVSRVRAPEGAAQLLVRRSARVASSRSRSLQTGPPVAEFVDAPPGGKRKIGYSYQVLPPVVEESGSAVDRGDPVGIGGGSRDTADPQLGSSAILLPLAGRKRSASGAAPGSGRRGPVPRPLASANDFSPSHFDEPNIS
jgi:hypothetical protein